MKKIILAIFILGIIFSGLNFVSYAHTENTETGINADEALAKLKEGNNHFRKMHLVHPDLSEARLHALEKGQHPLAAILCCSDSRVPPEIIFDQGLGDIFEIRNAGNVLDDQVIGSIEYALVHTGTKLVIVMGHQDCGAIKAACSKDPEDKYIESLTGFIKPSVEKAKKQKGNFYDNVAKNNAKAAAKGLVEKDSVIADYVKNHGVKIIPAYYSLHTGQVEFLNN